MNMPSSNIRVIFSQEYKLKEDAVIPAGDRQTT